LPDGRKNESGSAYGTKRYAEIAHPSEGPVDEYAKVEKQNGNLVESDGGFVGDLGAIEPLGRHTAFLVVRSGLLVSDGQPTWRAVMASSCVRLLWCLP